MPRRPRAVLTKLPPTDALPNDATEGVILARFALENPDVIGAEKVGSARRSDAASLSMAIAYLVAFFCSSNHDYGLRGFGQRLRPYAKRLAAAVGLERLPSSSAVSTLLNDVTPVQAAAACTALFKCSGVGSVLGDHRSTLVTDRLGNAYTVVDVDPTVLALRQRALPEDDDLPEPVRDSDSLAAPGYSGRHRGDVIVSACRTQMTGSGMWSALSLQAGNTALAPALRKAMQQMAAQNDCAAGRAWPVIVRIDGAGGNVPCLVQLRDANTLFVVRSAHYSILAHADVLQYLDVGPWQPVVDSLSGPRREALDLGCWPWHAASNSGEIATPRMVVTRFRSADPVRKHGAGLLLNGWHYELFGCQLAPDPWPAADVATLYFGRACLENRFAQENREIGLNRVFSYNLAGHMLATAVGMYVWNRRTCLGAELLGIQPDPVLPPMQPPSDLTLAVGVVQPQPTPPPPQPPPEISATAVLAMDWEPAMTNRSGWQQTPNGLRCPAGKTLRLRAGKTTVNGARKLTIVVRAPKTACKKCPLRSGCTKSENPSYRKEVTMVIGVTTATVLSTTAPKIVWQPPQQTAPTTAVVPMALPQLVPSFLRRAWLEAVRAAELRVFVTEPARQPKPPGYLARTPAERQHRRHSWAQRQTRHRLRPEVDVSLEFRQADKLERALTAAGFAVFAR